MKNFFKWAYDSTIQIALNEIIRILDKPFRFVDPVQGPGLEAIQAAAQFNQLSYMIIQEVSRNRYILDRTLIIQAGIFDGTYNIHDLQLEQPYVRLLVNQPVIMNRLRNLEPFRVIGPHTPEQLLPHLPAPHSPNTQTQSDQHREQEEKNSSESSFDFEETVQMLGNNLEESLKLTQRFLENLG